MTISLPLDIKELMTLTIPWESFQGFDGYAQPTYAAAVNLQCWLDPAGTAQGGETAYRRPDETVAAPIVDVYLDGDDPNARLVKLWDRFTPGIIANENRSLQACRIETLYGPPFDNVNPWLIIVGL